VIDLWQFELNSQSWVWLSGSKFVDTDSKSVAKYTFAASNAPGGRSNSAVFYSRPKKMMYVFGGGRNLQVTDGDLYNDFWAYKLSEVVTRSAILTTSATPPQPPVTRRPYLPPSQSESSGGLSSSAAAIVVGSVLLVATIAAVMLKARIAAAKLKYGEEVIESEDSYSHAIEIARNKRLALATRR
jgi:hypothetical protein